MRKKAVRPNWEETDQFLIDNFEKMTVREMAKALDLAPDTVSRRCREKLGLTKFERRPWTKEDDDFIRENYPKYGSPYCADKLKRTRTSVSKRASDLEALYVPKDTYIMNLGYRMVGKSKSRKLEHRKVMEEHLGRELRSDEIIHHIDGNKLNNVIENLTIMDRSSHARHHLKDTLQKPKRKRIIRKG